MRTIYLHFTRLIKNMGCLFVILFFVAGPWSVIIGLPLCFLISIMFFGTPMDVKKISEQFTEEELKILDAKNVEEHVSDDLYLSLYAKMMNLTNEQQFDEHKQKIKTNLTDEAFTLSYYFYDEEAKKDYEKKHPDIVKYVRNGLVKSFVPYARIKKSNRLLIIRYYEANSETYSETIIKPTDW